MLRGMGPLNPKLVLDPMWLCQANYVDLEYYTYVLLDAQSKYLRNLHQDFSNFYEVVFHYLNLNTIIADKKLYDANLKSVKADKNLLEIVNAMLTMEAGGEGKQIMLKASEILGDTLKAYLEKQTIALQNIHFYFNNPNIHRENKVYIVCRNSEQDSYDIIKLSTNSKRALGVTLVKCATLRIPELKENEFRARLLEHKPSLTDFKPERNVIVATFDGPINSLDALLLAKDTLLLNRIINTKDSFDSNVLLDSYRLLKKKKSIPYKLKV